MLAIKLLSLVLVALIGFAAHRASLCNVRAVAELMSAGTAHMLWSFGKAVLWTLLVAGSLMLWLGVAHAPVLARESVLITLLGSFVFGVGAAVNGGCSLSTLQRLADGNLSMLVTLAGLVLGVAGGLLWLQHWPGAALVPVSIAWVQWPQTAAAVLLALWAWAAHQLHGLWRLDRQRPWHERLLAPEYRLSASAALLGLGAGVLFAVQGAWTYTNFVRSEVAAGLGTSFAPGMWHAVLVAGLLGGMLVSALQRRSFAWQAALAGQPWARRLAGGALMGVGGALVPGGNDTLLLSALPTLSVQAVAAYAAMLAGIAATMAAMQWARLPMGRVQCWSEGCREASAPAAAIDTTASITGR